MACSESSMPSSMLMSMICAPFSTCCRATASASSYSPARISLENLGEPVTLVRSPMLTKLRVRPERQRLQSAEPRVRLDLRRHARRQSAHRFGDRLDVRGVGAAAAADDVQPAVARPILQLRRECFRRFGKAGRQQRIGQAGIRIAADVDGRDLRKFLDERPHFLRPERAVHADAQQRDVRNRIPERLDRLAGDAAVAAFLNERDGAITGICSF